MGACSATHCPVLLRTCRRLWPCNTSHSLMVRTLAQFAGLFIPMGAVATRRINCVQVSSPLALEAHGDFVIMYARGCCSSFAVLVGSSWPLVISTPRLSTILFHGLLHKSTLADYGFSEAPNPARRFSPVREVNKSYMRIWNGTLTKK